MAKLEIFPAPINITVSPFLTSLFKKSSTFLKSLNARVLVLIPFGFFSQLIKIRALYVLGFWFVLQFINSFLSSSSGGGVAYAAHIGGFISGVILILFFNKKSKKNNYKTKIKKINKGPWEQ